MLILPIKQLIKAYTVIVERLHNYMSYNWSKNLTRLNAATTVSDFRIPTFLVLGVVKKIFSALPKMGSFNGGPVSIAVIEQTTFGRMRPVAIAGALKD